MRVELIDCLSKTNIYHQQTTFRAHTLPSESQLILMVYVDKKRKLLKKKKPNSCSSPCKIKYWKHMFSAIFQINSEIFQFQLWDTLTVLTLVYVALLLAPTVPFYKHLEDKNNSSPADTVEDNDKSFDSEKIMALPYTICQ